MKIAHLTTVDMSLRYLVLPQLEAARDLGEAIGISAPGEYVEEIEERGIRHIALGDSTREMSLRSDWRAAKQLREILEEEQVDILHTHNPKPGLYGRVVGRLAGVPIVINTVHGLYATEESSLFKRALVYGAEFVASRFSDMELVQSPEDLDLMRRLHITSRKRTRLLGNGIDLDRFNPTAVRSDRDEVRSELGVEFDQILVGMVGRLVYEKGVRELIDAALNLDNRYVVIVVGPRDADKVDSIPDETLNRGADGGVRFLGMRRDIDRLYGAFDVFVLPSHREGFPRAAMEAAASGLPVIASDIRGCRQVVDDGVNGFLFPVRDAGALGDRIQKLGDDPGLRRSMGKASAEKAVAEFDERRVVERVVQAYRDVAREKGLLWKWSRTSTTSPSSMPPSRMQSRSPGLHQATITEGFLSRLSERDQICRGGAGFHRQQDRRLEHGSGPAREGAQRGRVRGLHPGGHLRPVRRLRRDRTHPRDPRRAADRRRCRGAGATYGGRPAGSYGEVAALSFNGNKIITTSGGGALVTDNEEWADRARFLATQARDPAPHYQHSEVGYNYRMSNLLAALGRSQLSDLERRVEIRRRHNAAYRQALADLPGVEFMPEAPDSDSTFWLTCSTISPAAPR